MSEAYQTKFNYTPGGEFELEGKSYKGLFNVYSDSTAYTGKYRTAESLPLTPASNFNTDLYLGEHFRDLQAFDELSLPRSRAEVQINFNELVNFTTINTKLKYLHENLLYVYSKMFVGSTDVPYAYDKTSGVSSITNEYGWIDTPNNFSMEFESWSKFGNVSGDELEVCKDLNSRIGSSDVAEVYSSNWRVIKGQALYTQKTFEVSSTPLTLSGNQTTSQNITGDVILLSFQDPFLVDNSTFQHEMIASNELLSSVDNPFVDQLLPINAKQAVVGRALIESNVVLSACTIKHSVTLTTQPINQYNLETYVGDDINKYLVFVNGLKQLPSIDYTLDSVNQRLQFTDIVAVSSCINVVSLSGSSGVGFEVLTGTDSSTYELTINNNLSNNQYLVYINGVHQELTSYTVSNSAITFASSVASNNIIQVVSVLGDVQFYSLSIASNSSKFYAIPRYSAPSTTTIGEEMEQYMVSINGITQAYESSYTITFDGTIVFAEPVIAGSTINIIPVKNLLTTQYNAAYELRTLAGYNSDLYRVFVSGNLLINQVDYTISEQYISFTQIDDTDVVTVWLLQGSSSPPLYSQQTIVGSGSAAYTLLVDTENSPNTEYLVFKHGVSGGLVNGVKLTPDVDYGVVDEVITFTEPLSTGLSAQVIHIPINASYSFQLNNSNYIQLDDNTYTLNNNDFTVEGWIKIYDDLPVDLSQAIPLFSIVDLDRSIVLKVSDLEHLELYIDDLHYTFNIELIEFKWHHVAITRQGSSVRAYIDGVLVGSNRTYEQMDYLKRFIVIPFTNRTGFSLLGITDTHMIGLTSDNTFSNISYPLLYTDVIDNFSQEKCQNLTDITFDGRYVYVTDSDINRGGQVFKYDVTGFYATDPAYETNRFLVRPLGGLGGKRDSIKFNRCGVIGAKPGIIFVADDGNSAIKVFNRDLVWKKTILLPKGSQQVLDIRYRELDDCMYFLVRNDAGEFVMYAYDAAYKKVSSVAFEDDLYADIDGAFSRLVFSEQDSNVFYVLTNSTVYKKFFSRPKKSFAVFERAKFGQSPVFRWDLETLTWGSNNKTWNYGNVNSSIITKDLTILPTDDGVDSLFVLGSNGTFFHFSEQTVYDTILRRPSLSFYNFDKIKLEQTENVQALTLNKELFKLYSNVVQLKNEIQGKFKFEYNGYGNLVYRNYLYLLDDEINKLNIDVNFNSRICDNEIIQAGTMNKVLMRVYGVQETLLELTKPFVLNFRTVVANENILMID